MKVQLNTDNHIQGDEALGDYVEQFVSDSLKRFAGQVMRVEVHLADTNAGKSGDNDKHCVMEARLEGRPPVAASADEPTVRGAIGSASRKLVRALESSLGKLGH